MPSDRIGPMKVAKQYGEVYARWGRLRIYRYASWHREVLIQWSDGLEPECWRTIYRLFGCWHLRRVKWRDEYFGVEGETCAGCMKQFNYSLTKREQFKRFLTGGSVELYRKHFL